MDRNGFARTTFRMFSGAIVWAAHFGALYTLNALACARGFADREWLGLGIVTAGVVAATVLALGAIVATTLPAMRAGHGGFENWMTMGISGLATVAIVWEGLVPVFLVPPCG